MVNENALKVLEKRYLLKDKDGRIIEDVGGMFKRVAVAMAKAEKTKENKEKWAIRFYNLMASLSFLPNSPTLMNAGTPLGQLAACYVLPVEDSIEGIFDAVRNAAIIHRTGGGTGFSFSRLRPKDSLVNSTGGKASGPVSFMKVFNEATEQIKQGGKRRGANMGILRVDHPDIVEFVKCKTTEGEFSNFNLSVAVTDKFMKAVHDKTGFELVCPATRVITEVVDAVELFDLIAKQAHMTGDPGIVFIDEVNRQHSLGTIEATNPCGEQPLLPMEACTLGSLNLSRCAIKNGKLDMENLVACAQTAVRFLDNSITVGNYPLPQIEKTVKKHRKIGLGVMGFADLLFKLEIPYNSKDALALAERLMRYIRDAGSLASEKYAEENGRQPNATITTIAPTGTISLIAGCSSGIEPVFALAYNQSVLDGETLLHVNEQLLADLKRYKLDSPAVIEEIKRTGSIQHIRGIPIGVKEIYVTAHEIDPKFHVEMQSAFQRYTDNAVSKTVNLPKDASVEDVQEIYRLAYTLRCKGITVFREGSKTGTLSRSRERPETLEGFTTKINTVHGNLYVTVSEHNGVPFELFATIGKSGKSTTAKTEAIGRLISLSFRSGISVRDVVEQLKGIGGEHPQFIDKELILSVPDAIAKMLEKRYLKDKVNGKSECPECGVMMVMEGGCSVCKECGFSTCG